MIIYENTRGGFINDIRTGSIATKVQNAFERHGIHHNNDAEYRAWGNSLMFMRNVLDDDDIPEDVSLAVEYQIPLTSKRVDFLIAGKDGAGTDTRISTRFYTHAVFYSSAVYHKLSVVSEMGRSKRK